MEIFENILIKDLGLYLKKERILILADFHMGFEESLSTEGVLVPRFQLRETLERLKKILNGIKVEKIIINGDLKHEFGEISETEWRHTLKLLDFLIDNCKEIILIKGNHDTILEPIADKREIKIKDYYKINKIFICHGDKIFKESKNCEVIIIGHEHPAIGLRKNNREEIFKCFLVGEFKKKKLIVIPSFNLVIEGLNILKEKTLSPFLRRQLDNFEVYVVADKIYFFGKLKNLRKL